jgi:hypothetical protein
MSQTYDMKTLESELSISQHLNWVLDNIYQNYKQGFNTLKEVLLLLKNGQNFQNEYQIEHYSNIVKTVEENIALWENQYGMYRISFGFVFSYYTNHIVFIFCTFFSLFFLLTIH